MTLPFDLGSYSWLIWVAGGILALVIVWGVIQAVFKLTIKIFIGGCLGIVVVGLACGAVAYFGR